MKRHTTTAALILLALAALPGSSHADTMTYDHDGEPLLSITFPAHWMVDTDYFAEARAAGTYNDGKPEIRIVEAMPDDGTRLWIGLWVAPRVSNLEKGLEYAESLDGDLLTNIESSEPEDTKLGGMAAKTFHGTAKRQGQEVEFAMALLEAREGVIVSVLYIGELETWAKHEDELNAIVESLRPAGG